MKALPKISIIIPSFNKALYLKKTLESIMSQDYPKLEVIIQDGGSTDGSLKIIKEFSKKYPKKINWVSKKDNGQTDAINKGIKASTGQVIAFINADDVYKKGALLKVGECFSENPQALWGVGLGEIIDGEGNQIFPLVSIYKNLLVKLDFYPLLLIVNYLTQPSVFLSKKAYQKYGPFISSKRNVMEYDLWLKLGRVKMPKVIGQTLSSFRLVSDNASIKRQKEILQADYQITKNYTRNPLILLFHHFHNSMRTKIAPKK